MDKNEKLVFRSSLGRSFDIEVIEDLQAQSSDTKEKIINNIYTITKKAWGDAKDLAHKWFDFSHVVLLAYGKNQCCGFALGSYVEEEILFLPATITTPEAQNRGLAIFLNGYLIRHFFLHMVITKKRDASKIADPFYIVFWTPNPHMYYLVARHIDLFPSPERNKATDKEKEIARKVIEFYSKSLSVNFDERRFVDVGCDANYPELIYKANHIPWSRDKKINSFFEDNLSLTEMKGHNFIILGKITLEDLIFKRV